MNCYIFYKIDNYYLQLPCDDKINFSDYDFEHILYKASTLLEAKKNKTIKGLLNVNENVINENIYKYIEISHKDYNLILIIEFKKSLLKILKILIDSKETNRTVNKVIRTIHNFKIGQRDKLFNKIIIEDNSLREVINTLTKYVFHDNYSLWLYNDESDIFTCIISSFKTEKEFITRNDSTELFKFVDDNDINYETRGLNLNVINSRQLKNMKSVTRLKLTLGDKNIIGLLSLYSSYENLGISERTNKLLVNFLRVKYLEIYQIEAQKLNEIEQLIATKYELGELENLMYLLVNSICDKLSFEACSIFLFDENTDSLIMQATKDAKLNGVPDNKIIYNINNLSLTTKAFHDGKAFSYDLQRDDLNTHQYDEKTECKPQNWTGICIKSNDKKFGVIRAKNKFKRENNSKIIINIRPVDILNLIRISERLASIIELNHFYNNSIVEMNEMLAAAERNHKESVKKLNIINDFYKIFLHEIRTPISKFNTGPQLIKRKIEKLRGHGVDDVLINDIKKKLDDIIVMGERLRFISTIYYFDQIVEGGTIEKLSVLEDIIFPVLNISRDYIKKQFGIRINLDHSSLSGNYVYCDKIRTNIVFNTLIDNAGKYNFENKDIHVYGKYDSKKDFFYIYVSNYGLPINEDEVDEIFKNNIRGKSAIDAKIGGTGIGLYLAKMIMLNQSGDLTLKSRTNPVIFSIKIPTNERS